MDPLSLIIATDRGEILYLSRDYDRAIAQVRGVLEMEPNFLQAHYILVFSLVQKGLFAEALADLEQWRGSDETPWSLMMDAYIHGRAGQQVQARRALQELERLRQRQPMDYAPLLLAHLGIYSDELLESDGTKGRAELLDTTVSQCRDLVQLPVAA